MDNLKKKDSMPLYNDWVRTLDECLDPQSAWNVVKALTALNMNIDIDASSMLSPEELVAYRMMAGTVIKNRQAYNRRCAANASNGAKGGRPRKVVD